MAPQDPLHENRLAPDIVFRAGRATLLPTPRFDKASPEVVRVRVRSVHEITEVDSGLDLPLEVRPAPEPPKVTRQRRKAEARKRPATLPAVVAVLRRAREYQQMIDLREVANRAELARRLGLTRARVTQVLHFLDLAPEIQAHLDALAPSSERFPLTERRLRDVARLPDPDEQIAAFERLARVKLTRAPEPTPGRDFRDAVPEIGTRASVSCARR